MGKIIKCACEREDCKSTLYLQGNDIMWVREKASDYNVLASIQLPPNVAQAIRDAVAIATVKDE